MKLQDDINFTSLNWIKHELDETLKQSRQALEAYVEDTHDDGLMRTCATLLHQVQGTLRMVELYGAAMVVEEMERLADALLADTVKQRDEAYSVLMRGMVQLPDYLERVQSGYKDIPIVLLPLLNDLRACRGDKLLSESALFAPDLDAPLPPDAQGSAAPVPAPELREKVTPLRSAFELALLRWFRDEQASQYPDRLLSVLDQLRALSFAPQARRLWWIAAGVIDAVRDRTLESSVSVKLLFGRVDRQIRRFAEFGENSLRAKAPRELAQNLLYYIAHSTGEGARVRAIREAFRLDSLLPTQTELKHAQGSMAGHNRSLLNTVAVAIKDDLLKEFKEALDIFLRSRAENPADLMVQTEVLDRVGDTLGMLGLGVPRRVVGEQRNIIEEIASGRQPADEGSLLDVAGALLYIEASLDDHIALLGAGGEESTGSTPLDLPRTEVRKILDTLMREAAVNIQQAKYDIIAFIEAPWDHAKVEAIPQLLEEIAGALRMLDFEQAAQLMGAIVRFVEVELLRRRRVPSAEQMDKLADALASIEYYLEATREQRGGREKILDVTRRSLERLGYWPPPEVAGLEGTATARGSKPAVPAVVDDLLLWDEHSPDSRNESPRFSAAADAGANDLGLPTIELPEHEAPVHFEDTAIPGTDDADLVPELSSAVDIMPGGDLGDLVIGETRSMEASSAHDTGLRFVDAGPADEADSGDRDASADWIEIDEQVEERIPQQGAVDTGFSISGLGDIDDDIRAVFIEEVEEEFERMRHQFHDWKADVDDFDNLKPLRRSFHTLKGSGRLVGAVVLGEFSWKVENLLNRVLDRAVTPGPAVQALIAHAIDALPELLKALRGGTSQANVAGITTTADRLAAGEEAWVPEFVPATRTVYHKVRRRVPVADAGDTGAPDVAPTHGDAGTSGAGPGRGLLADIDPVLFDILKTEVAGHLATVGAYLDECSPEPLVPTEPALRAVHTLTGAIAMVDIPTIAEVLAPLEGYFKRLRAASQPPLAAGVALIGEALALVRDIMTGLESGAGELPDAGPLAARIATLRDGLPEPAMSLESLIVIGDEPALLDQHTSVPADLEAAIADREPAPDAESDAREQEADQGQEADRQQEVAASGDDVPGESVEVLPAYLFAEPMPSSAADPSPAGQEADGIDEFISPATVVASATTHALDDALAAADSRPEPVSTPDIPVADAPSEATSGPPAPLPQERFERPDLDEDLLEIFVQEGADILDHSDGLMAGLRDAPGERATLAGLQRDLHTLKGGSRMVGLAPIGDLVHAMESLLEAIDEGRREMNQASIELLERGFDQLHELMQQVTQHQAIEMPVRTIARLAMLVEGRAAPPDEAAAVPTGATGSAGADDATAAPGAPGASPPAARQMPTLDEEEVARAPQEMIRVRSDLLDSLVNYAGEVSIYRSRLEQQISGFRFNLVEFEQTVSRLREQLRKLEIETEAQIIARFQREHQEGLASFDPLELDRFSQLQQYSRALGESVSDLVSIQGLLDDITRQSETLLLQQSRVSSDLQEGLMRTRMVPFDSLVPSLRRTLRQAAQELGKQAQLKVEGAQGEMDRNLLERMKAPFEHMLRNALAHGIEAPADRLAAGKPPEGLVNIAVSRDATEVVLRVSDDGRGMDRDAIRSKAIERGLLKPEVQLSDRDLYGFVLETGFSTLDEVTQLAGRGVGMDVVHNEIKQLGGSLRIDSEAGRGTAFTLRLPFTLAVTQAILVKLGESVHAIPMSSVAGVVRMERADFVRRLASNSPTYEYAGESFTLYELSQLLGVAGGSNLDETQVPVLMTRTGDQRAGVCIDAVVGSREIVVKSVGPQISSVPGIFGATIMGDGSVVMILDLAPLVRRTIALRARAAGGEVMDLPRAPVAPAVPVRRRQPLIMVVDDSITMRKVTTRVLERAEMDVVTAKDGLDAVEKLQEKIPDLMLLDIEMPRMDGYELATYMKNDSRLRHVPIIMITSRTGEKHRQRALEIGVERYLGKPYQETDLVQNVRETLESVGAQA